MLHRFLRIAPAPAIAAFLALAQLPSDNVIRINVNLVQVDAVVTDSKDQPVTDLKAEDFEIRQDGKVQTISNFAFINTKAAGVRAAAPGKSGGAVTLPVSPAPLNAAQVRRTFAFLVDDLALDPSGVVYVRKALEKFVDEEMQPSDLAAIIRTTSGLGLLQQFTNDKRILHTAISHILFNAMGRVGTNGFAETRGAAMEERSSMLTAGSLGAINYVVSGLKDLPGRKTIILFTEDLRLLRPDGTDTRAQYYLERLVDSANQSSVVISSVDPRGLQTYGPTAADSVSARGAINMESRRSANVFYSQDGMVRLADATGGLFLHNNNDITGAVRRVVEDGDGYYLIGYHPDAATFTAMGSARFHNIKLKVKRPGLHVRSREGFFGSPDPPQRTVALTPQANLVRAATSPFVSTDIHVRLTGLFMHSAEAGSFVNALLYIDPHDIHFEDAPDDMHKAVLDVAIMTFNENGIAENPVEQIHTLTLPAADYQRYMRDGVVYVLRHPVKKPGGYQMRIAVRDNATLRMGSASQYIEVPDLTKQHLELTAVVLSRAATGAPAAGNGAARAQEELNTAAIRQFQRGDQISYSCRVINAHVDAGGQPQLEMEIHVFRDEKEVAKSGAQAVPVTGATDREHLRAFGSFAVGPEFQPGDYVLQVIITDKLANVKTRVAQQWMDFQVK